MGSHAYCRFILKTPEGYLTPTGVAKDIGDESVLVLNIYEVGGWSMHRDKNIRKFLEHSTVKADPEKCKLLQYSCHRDDYYNCSECPMKETCKLWTDRKNCKFT